MRVLDRLDRRYVWGGLIVLATVVLLAVLFVKVFERVPVTRHVDESREAQRNPLLALERFLAVMGRPATVLDSARALDSLPAGGVLVLGAQRRAAMTVERVHALVAWIERGGHLIVEAEPNDSDPLLDELGVRVARPTRPLTAPPASTARAARQSPMAVVRLRAGSRDLRVEFVRTLRSLKATHASPVWSAGAGTTTYLMELRRGDGRATVVLSLWELLVNQKIGVGDNAELAWALVNSGAASGPVLVLWRALTPTLWQWLDESAWMILVSGALLIALWLWSVVPRFGPIVADPVAGRRSLADHLHAMGRAVWRAKEEEGLRYWLFCARRTLLARAQTRDVTLTRLAPPEQAERVAALVAGRGVASERAIRIAIAGQQSSADSRLVREGFTRLIALLQKIETTLQ